MFYFEDGCLLPSFSLWHEGRDVSDILGFCGAWDVTGCAARGGGGWGCAGSTKDARWAVARVIYFVHIKQMVDVSAINNVSLGACYIYISF